MSRVLMVVPPLVGHVNPTVALGHALRARGHDVAWIGYAEVLERLLDAGDDVLALSHDLTADAFAQIRAKGAGLRGARAFKFLWEDFFVPLARQMLPGVEAAIDRWAPDLLVVDQQTFGGALAARRKGLPWLTSASTSASLVDPLDGLPQFRAWMVEQFAQLQTDAGLPATSTDFVSPHGVLVWSTEALVGEADDRPAHWHFVGPAMGARPTPVDFPWDRLRDDRPTVLVSLGTVNAEAGARFFGEVCEALADGAIQAVLVAPEALVPQPPPHAIVQAFVPQLELLPHMDAVVCHAGHNTTVEALAHGLPLVVAPIRDDQPVVAQQVVAAGAGVRVRFGRVRAATIRRALDAVLTEPGHREAAQAIGASFRAAGGVDAACEVVEGTIRDAAGPPPAR